MNQSFQKFLQTTLTALEQRNLKRSLTPVSGAQGPSVTVKGQRFLNFCSNDYLGLANDSRIREAARQALENGFGSGASRLVCGNMSAHQKLEEAIAEFKDTESALVFSSGYMANTGIIPAVFDRHDIIFSDKLNHASILDGISLSGASLKRYPHLNMDALEEMLKQETGYQKRGIVTDSVFSMDGDIAPLDRLTQLAKKHDCILLIDEAHALGVLGKNGKGAAEHFGVEKDIDIHMGTLSKALGCFGAYAAGTKHLTDFLLNKARSFIYTTGMPPSNARAALKAFEILQDDTDLRARLKENTDYMHKALREAEFDIGRTRTPIIPVMIGDEAKALEYSRRLRDQGIWITAIRTPTVPRNQARLRLTVTAAHTREELDTCLKHLKEIKKKI